MFDDMQGDTHEDAEAGDGGIESVGNGSEGGGRAVGEDGRGVRGERQDALPRPVGRPRTGLFDQADEGVSEVGGERNSEEARGREPGQLGADAERAPLGAQEHLPGAGRSHLDLSQADGLSIEMYLMGEHRVSSAYSVRP